MVQRAIFQGVASMGLPAFTIHSIVRYSGRALKDAKNKNIRAYGPIGVSTAFALTTSPTHTYEDTAWPGCRAIPAFRF